MTQENQGLDLNLDLGAAEAGTVILDQEQGEVVDAEFQVTPDHQPSQESEAVLQSADSSSTSDPGQTESLEQNSPEKPPIDPRAEMARQIEELQKEVADQACEVARRAGGLKSAKKEFDGLVEELRDLERRFEAGDYGLAFNPAKAAGDAGD